LQHPHIVPVYLVASEGGLHYYVMQLIAGRTLAAVIAARKAGDGPAREFASPRRAAELGRQAALALHFAHEQGITHRDVKPSNLLVDELGKLWVSDFGLARIAGQTDLTLSGAVLGTLRYMSPEQASGARLAVDHRCDIYALGVTLYELITGRPAFEGEDRVELLRGICVQEPLSPRRIDPAIPRDLETIVLKAMAKEPGERYAAALDLADDLERFLSGRPILARPPRAIDHAAKWARRHRSAAATVMILSVAVLGGAALWRDGVLRRHNRDLKAALERAERNETSTRRLMYDSQVKLAGQAWESGQVEFARQTLEAIQPESNGYDPRGFEWHYLRRACRRDISVLSRQERLATALTLSPDGGTLVTGHRDGTLVFWDLNAGRERVRLRAHPREVSGLLFSPDGRALASRSSVLGQPAEVKLWNPISARPLANIPTGENYIIDMTFSHDALRLYLLEHDRAADPNKNQMVSWDLARGLEHPEPGPPPIPCSRMAASRDGRWLMTSATSGLLTLRDSATGEPTKTLPRSFPWIAELACSPDGQIVAVVDRMGISFWDVATARELGSIPCHLVGPPTFSPDGNRLAGRADDGRAIVLIKDVRTAPRRIPLEKASGSNLVFAFSPDGERIAAGGIAGRYATVGESSSGRKLDELPDGGGRVGNLGFTAAGDSVIVPVEEGPVLIWRLDRRVEPFTRLAGHENEVWGLKYTPDGTALISSSDDHLIKIWDPRGGGLRATLEGHESLVAAVAVSPDGTRLASAGFDRTVRLWDLPTGRPRRVLRGHTDRVRTVAFSPDGRWVASAGSDRAVRVWDVERGEPVRNFEDHRDTVRALAFNPRSGLLVSAGDDRTIRGFDVEGGREVFALEGAQHFPALAFSPDGSLLASGNETGDVTIWDAATRSKRWSSKGSDAEVWGLSFSRDGRTLAAACGDAQIRLWDPITGQVMLVLDGHSKRVNAVAFSPDRRALASACHDGEVRIWRAHPP
jgi:WD40 repeat protein